MYVAKSLWKFLKSQGTASLFSMDSFSVASPFHTFQLHAPPPAPLEGDLGAAYLLVCLVKLLQPLQGVISLLSPLLGMLDWLCQHHHQYILKAQLFLPSDVLCHSLCCVFNGSSELSCSPLDILHRGVDLLHPDRHLWTCGPVCTLDCRGPDTLKRNLESLETVFMKCFLISKRRQILLEAEQEGGEATSDYWRWMRRMTYEAEVNKMMSHQWHTLLSLANTKDEDI